MPVAFHVNYWDYIGWKDRYATKKFGQRQSRYASLKRNLTVYPPCFYGKWFELASGSILKRTT